MIRKKNQKIGRYKFLHKMYTFLGYIFLLESVVLVILFNVPLIKININMEYLSILILTVGLFVYFRINTLHYHSLIYLIENVPAKSGEIRKPKEKRLRAEY